ncbi:Hsp70 family protein [Streptomyces sp. NPDC001401]|uniref:Hsp70 family protein n=1 Tax=Streptomyces sp. NPDC001401 TaxID=3364570 RepID=UPI0036810B0A
MKAIGIDLGTTNSAVSRYEGGPGTAKILSNSDGETLTPSVVGLRKGAGGQARQLVGRSAVNYAAAQPADTIFSVKRLMGRDFADPVVKEAAGRLNYEIVPGAGDDPRAHVVLGGEMRTPAEISRLILDKLKRDAGRALGEEITHAVITVPAYFRDAQRAATREAGQMAGLVVKKIIDEPTAAAIAFGLELPEQERKRVLVYDLGGGTFDISILQMTRDRTGRNHFQVLHFAGDNWLGGDDFDNMIVDRVLEEVVQDAGTATVADRHLRLQVKRKAEEVKRALSQAESIEDEEDLIIPGAFKFPDGGLGDVETTISLGEFNRMVKPLVERTMGMVREALADQALTRDDITDVLLVGGSTLLPQVYRTVEAEFGADKVRRDVNPMECVALGAGILAGTMEGVECPDSACGRTNDEAAERCTHCGTSLVGAAPAPTAPRIYEVTGMSLGIAAVRGHQQDAFVPIIPRGTPYPLPEPMTRTFQATSGRRIRVPVYEGDSNVASKNHEQGVVEYDLPNEIDVDSRVEVTFNYDADRIVTVHIAVPGTDMAHSTTLRTDTPRTPPPQARALDDGEADVRAEVEITIAEVKRFLQEQGPYLDSAQAMKIRRDLEQAERAKAFSDEAECERMINVLRKDLFSSGVASQLLLAEQATYSAAPALAREIQDTARKLQSAHHSGNRALTEQHAMHLNNLIGRAFRDRDVESAETYEDHGGLLRFD